MKKFFTLILMALACTMAWATDVTITTANLGVDNGNDAGTVTVEGVTLAFEQGTNERNVPKYYTSGTAIRMYPGNTLTITAPGNIQQIVFNNAATTSRNDNGSGATWNTGAFADGTWTGDAATVVMTNATTKQIRILGLTVTYNSTATGVDDVTAAKTVQSVRYYNLAGQQSAEPFTGVNIVATTYTDGTSTAVKQIVK